MTWHRVVCTPSGADRTADVVAAMFASGVEGVHEDGDTLVTHVPEERAAIALLAHVRSVDAGVACAISELGMSTGPPRGARPSVRTRSVTSPSHRRGSRTNWTPITRW